MMDCREENLQKLHEYVRALEEERRKIEMFQRELPLSLDIVTRTIESYRERLSGGGTPTTTTTTQGSEQTTSEGPVLEEFIPLKRTCSSTRENEEEEDDDEELGSEKNSGDFDGKSSLEKKSDWLSSVQLWNQSPYPGLGPNNELPKKVAVVEVMRGSPRAGATSTSACSTAGQQRKSRRCWSPELHRRFLIALDQLGGSHAATPKQIRDLMKVDGLTNDEVKSHLQKYRLHSRRPASSSVVHNHNNDNNGSTQSKALLVVGGIWMAPPPPQTQGASAAAAACCNSAANSSSTHTVTASPAY